MSLTTEPRRCPLSNLAPCTDECVFFNKNVDNCEIAANLNSIAIALCGIDGTFESIDEAIPKPIRKHSRVDKNRL